MVLFLIPIVAGAAAYGAATQDESGSYSAGDGDRKIDCYQIWQQITTGEGPQSLADGQAAAGRLKGNYETRISTIDQLTAEMDAAWTGTAGEAAKSGGHPLKVWMQDSKDKLNDSDKYLGEQYNAFTTVHSKVQEVPKEPPESGFLNDIKPWETDTDRAIEEYNTKGQANVDAFNAYFKSSGDNGQGMPTYNAMSGQVQAVDVNDNGGGGDDGDGKDKNGNDTGGGENSGGPGRGGYTPGNIPGANIPGGGGPGSGGYTPGNIPGAGGPGSGGYTPGNIPGYNPGDVPGGPGSPGYKPPAWDGGTGAAGYTPGKIPAAGGFGPGGSGGFGPGGAGDIPGAEGFGPGGGGGFGPGSGGNIGAGGAGAGAGFGPGGQSGAGAGAGAGKGMGMGGAAMGGAAAAGAAGARGMGGGMGMGGMGAGGGRGQGAEDEERQSRFLLGDDPNEVFGTDELTAPPVIGE
ncbi:hypothetical protein [Amycolatopsis sp. YIM 10]|uniref:hypothetical protein n=1 Tax=Amycolatopsis sp. YIM 10 TaxID=2653857 RepID=UPI0012A898CD|nr:hypothetical protein YIM_47945 [Amycolatopsis sp. YIM 10]